MVEVKIRKFGNSLGMILPKEVLQRLHAGEGEHVLLVETADGGYQLAPADVEFEHQLAIAETGMHRYRNTLRALAK